MAYQKNDPEYNRQYYAQNRERLLQRRRERYAQEPEYRDRRLEASKKQRDLRRHQNPRPEGYDVDFPTAAEQVGVTVWALREWRKKDYFPEPVNWGGRLWFTENQVLLLLKLKEFFDEYGIRMGIAKRGKLEEKVNWVFANWE